MYQKDQLDGGSLGRFLETTLELGNEMTDEHRLAEKR